MSEYSEDFGGEDGPGPVAEREESVGIHSDDGSSLLASGSVASAAPSKPAAAAAAAAPKPAATAPLSDDDDTASLMESSVVSAAPPAKPAAAKPAPTRPTSDDGTASLMESSVVSAAPPAKRAPSKAASIKPASDDDDTASLMESSIVSAAPPTKPAAAKPPSPDESASLMDSSIVSAAPPAKPPTAKVSSGGDTASLLASSSIVSAAPPASRPVAKQASVASAAAKSESGSVASTAKPGGAKSGKAAESEDEDEEYEDDHEEADEEEEEEEEEKSAAYSPAVVQARAQWAKDNMSQKEIDALTRSMQDDEMVQGSAPSTATSIMPKRSAPAPAPAKKPNPAESVMSDDTQALMESSSVVSSKVSRPVSKAAPTAKSMAKSGSVGGSSQASSRVQSKQGSKQQRRTSEAFEEEEVEDDDTVSQSGTVPEHGDFEFGGKSVKSAKTRPPMSQSDMQTSVMTDDYEPIVTIVKPRDAGPRQRPMSARKHSTGGSSTQATSPRSTNNRPTSAAATARRPVAGSWLDDSWEGEVMPTIIPAQSGGGALAQQQPARPGAPQPQASAAGSVASFRRGGARRTESRTSMMSMTSGSVAGALVSAPPVYVAGPAWGSRPVSAGPRLRASTGAQEADLLRRNPQTWDVRDVAEWVAYIGMGQYRKKFLHNCIDGRLLLVLSDVVLKQELGVGPLGHRAAIIQAITALAGQAADMQPGASASASPTKRTRPASARPASAGVRNSDMPRRPASATRPGLIPPDSFLGPALGKITVYEQRSKLLFELDRAAARAAQHRVIAEQLNHTAALSADEVAHLRGLLQDLERKNKLVMGRSLGTVDSAGCVPWRPASPHVLNPHPERMGKPGDDPSIDMTFQPRISKRSASLLNEQQDSSAGHRSTFLDRLESDARKRERSRMESDRKFYSPEALFNDPLLAKRKARKDYQFLTSYLGEKGMISKEISQKDSESDEVIDGLLQRFQDELNVPVAQLAGIHNARGTRKVSLLASALRTHQFMSRYDAEDRDRRSGAKLQSLQEKHWEAQMGKPKEKKAAEDLAQAVKYFEQLGWCGEDAITDDRLGALLKRVTAFKQATEKARDQKAAGQGDGTPFVDFAQYPWAGDGLASLQESAPGTGRIAVEAAASKAAPPTTTVKTGLAPDGDVTAGPETDSVDFVGYTTRLLSKCRWDDIEKMDNWSGTAKQLGVYRHIRTQKFIEFTETEIKAKERKLQETYQSMRPQTKVLSKTDANAFYDRLLEDASKRQASKEKLIADKADKDAKIKASSAMYGSGQRPRSAR